jgi:hypothetical protein
MVNKSNKKMICRQEVTIMLTEVGEEEEEVTKAQDLIMRVKLLSTERKERLQQLKRRQRVKI